MVLVLSIYRKLRETGLTEIIPQIRILTTEGQYPKQMLSACLHSEFPPVHCQWVTAVGTGLNLVELERQAVYFFFTKRALTLRHAISVQVRYF